MSVIDSLHSYFKTFPGFLARRLDIDCLDKDPDSYSLDCEPTERVIKRYMDGGSVRRQLFTISSRVCYGPDLTQQQENVHFFETLEDWLLSQERSGVLPDLGMKRRARSLEVISSAYPIEANDGEGGTTARYQIQMELIYLQEV